MAWLVIRSAKGEPLQAILVTARTGRVSEIWAIRLVGAEIGPEKYCCQGSPANDQRNNCFGHSVTPRSEIVGAGSTRCRHRERP